MRNISMVTLSLLSGVACILAFQNCGSKGSSTSASAPASNSSQSTVFDPSIQIFDKFDLTSLSALEIGTGMPTTVTIDHANRLLNVVNGTCGDVSIQLDSGYYMALMEALQTAQENYIYSSHMTYAAQPALTYNLYLLELDFQNYSLPVVIDDGQLDQDAVITQGDPRGVLSNAQSLRVQLDAIGDLVAAKAVYPNCTPQPPTEQPLANSVSVNLVPAAAAAVAVDSSTYAIPFQDILRISTDMLDPNPNPPLSDAPLYLRLYVSINQSQQTVQVALANRAWTAAPAGLYQQLVSQLNSTNLLPYDSSGWAAGTSYGISFTLSDGTTTTWSSNATSALATNLFSIAAGMYQAKPSCMVN